MIRTLLNKLDLALEWLIKGVRILANMDAPLSPVPVIRAVLPDKEIERYNEAARRTIKPKARDDPKGAI